MEYSDAYLREQLPKENPSSEYVPPDVEREIVSWREKGEFDDPELLARSVRWTYAIFSEFSLGNYRYTEGKGLGFFPWGPCVLPYDQQVTVGLYDKDKERAGFGLALNVPQGVGPPFYIADYIEFPRLQQRFPFAVRQVTTELHSPPNPVNATTTCWAKCNSSGKWGLITAGHAVGTNLVGLSVPLDDGSMALSHKSFWQPIDAAFILSAAPTEPVSSLKIINFPASGLPVNVVCKGNKQSRTVASACNSQGFYQTRLFPVLFFLNQPCSPGDSGALVQLNTGEACGIYNGSQPSPDTGGTSGRVLNFAQAMFALDTSGFL
ncbi:hypothetical protein LXM94_07375 [Rhizobium sp. TRM95111]|uniref:hypothetical protein n=1 Tax=Rhizobium alarense TaxID=2846851 RepID=UPI001F30F6C7|nr:hypothetical protein [Rhizobium alarense]MCF3639789.1 hypothetical protein [Rhizobium alarense]